MAEANHSQPVEDMTMTSASPNSLDSSRFRFVTNWQAMDAGDAEAIKAFWRREGAFTDDAPMAARLPQIVLHAREGDEVAAVCTAVPVTPPAFGQPVYYFRAFVGKAWRSTRLFVLLWRHAQPLLETYAREHGFPCIGILLELENNRFKEKGRMPVWPHTDLVYIGKSGRGLETRVYYFKGAKLKPAQ